MKKLLLWLLLVLSVAVAVSAQEADKGSEESQIFKVGGISVIIPSPGFDMVEAGYDIREFSEVFTAPTENRLLAIFMLAKDVAKFTAGGNNQFIHPYALVEVTRRGEYMEYGTQDFKAITDALEQGNFDTNTESAEEEVNRRLASLDLEELAVHIGQPAMLGRLFSKEDMYGLGMVMAFSMGEMIINEGCCCALVRVKQRVIFLYLYDEYKGEETVRWLRTTTEEWASAILDANR